MCLPALHFAWRVGFLHVGHALTVGRAVPPGRALPAGRWALPDASWALPDALHAEACLAYVGARCLQGRRWARRAGHCLMRCTRRPAWRAWAANLPSYLVSLTLILLGRRRYQYLGQFNCASPREYSRHEGEGIQWAG